MQSNRYYSFKPQVKESKRQFIFDVVNEGGESEKMELFVNFCEDTIFEMQLASLISEPDAAMKCENNLSPFAKAQNYRVSIKSGDSVQSSRIVRIDTAS